MHKVVVDEPYQFVPPYRGKWLSWLFRLWLKPWLRKNYGIIGCSYEGLEHLRASIAAGHGILLCPNHSRDSDPMLMGMLCRKVPTHVFSLASWHLFKQSPVESFVIRRLGGFSIYREGLDRQALDAAVQIVSTAERPLIIFPEGVITRANDRLGSLMDGVSFIARVAAKKRAEKDPAAKVVVHPMALRYQLIGDVEKSVKPILTALEQRTFYKAYEHEPIQNRIRRLALAVLASREVEILGDSQQGPIRPRIIRLLNELLQPNERRWLGRAKKGDVVGRVKDLRAAIVPELLSGSLQEHERAERWRVLTDCYYAQALSMYPEDYLDDADRGSVTPERIVETVHRLEEDLTDKVTIRPEWRVHFRIGEAIEVETGRKPRGEDPLMMELRRRMLGLLEIQDWWPPEPVEPAE